MSDRGDARHGNDLSIVYDGHCPFCSSYVRLYTIRESGRRVNLIDGRSPHPLVDEILRQKLDLDQGMVVKMGNRMYHGAAALNVLAILGSNGTLFNRINRALFQRPRLASWLYPLLAWGRLITLRCLGRKLIGEP
jgi:predicted DCC family thiol-disulfide oxidoreductase YuxK